MESQTEKVLELVVFRLGEGATRDELLGTVGAVSEWIGEQPGFLSRELLHDNESGRWIDLAWWRTLEDAQAAAEKAMTSETCAPMFSLIDMDSTLMVHGVPVHPAGA